MEQKVWHFFLSFSSFIIHYFVPVPSIQGQPGASGADLPVVHFCPLHIGIGLWPSGIF
jgi:hypothetical protein